MSSNERSTREWTPEEVRSHFLEHVRILIKHWANVKEHLGETYSDEDRISGFAHSLLAAIDGCAGLPGFALAPKFLLVPVPHHDDKEYHELQGENYYPVNNDVNCDIAGDLHRLLYQKEGELNEKEF